MQYGLNFGTTFLAATCCQWRKFDSVNAQVEGRVAGVVERDGLENRCTRERTEGSNPSPSASQDVIGGKTD